MAQRIAKVELLRRRNSGGNPVGTGTFLLPMAGYQQTALDIITMTLPFLGWTNKILEVQAHRLHIDEHGMLGVEIDVQETASSNYGWALAEQLTPQGYQQTNPFGTQSPNIYTVGAAPGGGDFLEIEVNGTTLYDTITVNGV
jgi:hypothetical protein